MPRSKAKPAANAEAKVEAEADAKVAADEEEPKPKRGRGGSSKKPQAQVAQEEEAKPVRKSKRKAAQSSSTDEVAAEQVAPAPKTTRAKRAKADETPAVVAEPPAPKGSRTKRAKADETLTVATEPPPAKASRVKRAKAEETPAAPVAAAVVTVPPAKVSKGKHPQAVATSASPPPTAPKSGSSLRKTHVVDGFCPFRGSCQVIDDFSVMLNQADIGRNANKFYKLQLLGSNSFFQVWTRWGRVGEVGQSKMLGPFGDLAEAIKGFEQKFKDKTGNNWSERGRFVVKSNKYEIIETTDEPVKPAVASPIATTVASLPCKLDPTTIQLMEFITSANMFKQAMAEQKIDVERLPLGAISEQQIARGFNVLTDLQTEITGSKRYDVLKQLSSNFYQVIPHAFTRSQVPPVINTVEVVTDKINMLNMLTDISIGHELTTTVSESSEHPLDKLYREMAIDLKLLNTSSPSYKVAAKYVQNTMGSTWQALSLENIWELRRHPEDASFNTHASLGNRRLLWHGTNVAVVAAILKTGLRIMPHSGGRVGKGIYLASELNKSSAYTRPARRHDSKNIGILFLVEAALGNPKLISRDDSSITKPPSGYDSVIAMGRQQPDPSKDEVITLDGQSVTVPVGAPAPNAEFAGSSFHQNEYLVYKESQQRLRFICTFRFGP